MQSYYRSIKQALLLVLLLCCSIGVYALDSDDEDEALTPDDNLVSDIISAVKEKSKEEKETAKKEKREAKFEHVVLRLAKGAPIIDGDLSDEFWKQATPVDLIYEVSPARLADAKLKTKARLATTHSHIYISFDAEDPNPDQLRSAPRAHDGGKEDDYVSFSIDTAGTGARMYEFRVNPHGAKGDTINDKIAKRNNHDWDANWEAAAVMHENGYRVEMRIPQTAVRPPKNVVEGRTGLILFKRFVPRRLKTVNAGFFTYDANQLKIDTAKFLAENPSLAVAGLDRWYGTMHGIVHQDETRKLGEKEWTQVAEHDEYSAGIDVLHYQIDSSMSLDFTYKPNFIEVEGDIARDSLSKAFKKFKPEKRAFFQGAAEYYTSTIPVVYTRNISQPKAGVFFVDDNINKATSAFYVNDNKTELVIPSIFQNEKINILESSNSAAFRYRSSNVKGNGIGVIGTLRSAEDYHNYVVGIDGYWKINDDNNVRYQILGSDSKYPRRFAEEVCEKGDCLGEDFPDDVENCPLGDCSINAPVLRTNFGESLQGHYLKARYDNSTRKGEFFVDYYEISPEFRGDLGFIRQVNVRLLSASYGKKWYKTFSEKDGGRSRIRAYVNAMHARSHSDNANISTKFGGFIQWSGSFLSTISIGKSIGEKAVGRTNRASLAVEDNAPLFDEDYWIIKFVTSPFKSWKFDLTGRVGQFADKNVLAVVDKVEWSPILSFVTGNFEFITEYIYRNVDLDDSPLYQERFYTLKFLWRPNPRMSHRFLYLYDRDKQDVDRMPDQNIPKKTKGTLEYSFIYDPNRSWSIITGIKGKSSSASDKRNGEADWINREYYFKVEFHFNKS